ncbi:MAG TPA: HdeD family acid-resistance protein [Thermoanaerobaculia bacterium]|nr:HdeD family acid-resistance protein [Thermoanaerobaculia bacterium]
MLTLLSKNWWVFLVRGLVAILFGLMAFAWPGLTLATLVIFFGAWALVSGVFAIAAAFSAMKGHRDWWVLLLQGLLGIAVGLLTFRNPAITAISILWYLAFWSIVTGVIEFVTAFRLRKEIHGEGWLMLAGAAAVVFGLLLIARPGAGALALITLIAAYAIVFGVILVVAAFKLKGLRSGPARA